MKPITRDAAEEMADQLRSAYPIDGNGVAMFLGAADPKAKNIGHVNTVRVWCRDGYPGMDQFGSQQHTPGRRPL